MDPGVLQTIGLKRVEHDLATEQQQPFIHLHFPSPTILSTVAAAAAKSLQSLSDSVRPQRQQPTRLSPSLGFSRQEQWSGLPFPSPMHESEK